VGGKGVSESIRVLVVDDSALMRKLIPQLLRRDPGIEVVGTAMDGEFALEKIEQLKPHVVTLDLEMPRMGGIEALRQIMRRYRLPVIVVSAYSTQGAAVTFKALAMGAFDFVDKPHSDRMDEIAGNLAAKIHAAAQAGVVSLPVAVPELRATPKAPRSLAPPTRVVAIGVSTGGPNSLQQVLSALPSDFPGAILIVQHMPPGFTEMFARRLDECCAIEVKEAQSGDLLAAGRALVCPGNRHLKVRHLPLGDVAVLCDGDLVNGHRPSVDVLFRSVAEAIGPRAIGVLMTGMGEDGAAGMGDIKAAGGLTIAQSAESCVVFGMPRAAIERGHAMRVLPLDALAASLQTQCSRVARAVVREEASSAGDGRASVPLGKPAARRRVNAAAD
jgi:two-component system chemotaxis response regulator CheB